MDKVKSALHIGSKSKEERIANHPATGGASSTVPSHTGTGTHTGAAHTGAAHTGFDDGMTQFHNTTHLQHVYTSTYMLCKLTILPPR